MHKRIRTDTVGMHKKVSEHTPFICSKAFTRSTGSTLSSDKFGSWKGNKIYHFIIHNYINNKKSRKLITLPISREAELLSSPELISYFFFTLTICRFIIRRKLNIIHCYKIKNNKGQSYSVWKKRCKLIGWLHSNLTVIMRCRWRKLCSSKKLWRTTKATTYS